MKKLYILPLIIFFISCEKNDHTGLDLKKLAALAAIDTSSWLVVLVLMFLYNFYVIIKYAYTSFLFQFTSSESAMVIRGIETFL